VYVLARVLRARFEHVYQLALLSGELREVFERAPPVAGDAGAAAGGGGAGKRKPVEGDCPICFCEMEEDESGEPVVWCRAACGQNIHKGCFETWAATKRRQAGEGGNAEVTCPYCRSVWEGDEDMIKMIRKDGKRNEEGYVNVASQLGISTYRGESCIVFYWPRGWLTSGFFQTTAHTRDGGLATRPATDAGTIEAAIKCLRRLVWPAGDKSRVRILIHLR
jgi:hypothetical protein